MNEKSRNLNKKDAGASTLFFEHILKCDLFNSMSMKCNQFINFTRG